MTYNALVKEGLLSGNPGRLKEELFLTDCINKIIPKTEAIVSDTKGSSFKTYQHYAVKYNYVSFGKSTYLPTVSVDIEHDLSDNQIKHICNKHNIPLPNLVVKTNRGIHLHWVLEYGINTANPKQARLYSYIARAVVSVFDGDTKAVPVRRARKFRNPLKHPVKILSYTFIDSLMQFKPLLSSERLQTIKKDLRKGKLPVTRKEVLSSSIGNRNTNLFNYLRKFAYKKYRTSSLEELRDIIEAEAYYINSRLEDPLTNDEVATIVDSVYTFMVTKYTGVANNNSVIEFNQKLALAKHLKVVNKIFNKVLEHPYMTLQALAKLSKRRGAAVFGVSATTYLTYRKQLKELFMFLIEYKKKQGEFVELMEGFISVIIYRARPIINEYWDSDIRREWEFERFFVSFPE
jgi:hypothetical protein